MKKVILLFYMCHSMMGLTRCYKTAVFLHFIELISRDVFEDNIVHSKAKTAGLRCQGQGHTTLRPRPPKFVLKVSSRTRTVLEYHIPANIAIAIRILLCLGQRFSTLINCTLTNENETHFVSLFGRRHDGGDPDVCHSRC